MRRILSDESLDTLFRNACSPAAWLDRPVGDITLRAVWELTKLGPTPEWSSLGQVAFVRSAKAKERLVPALSPDERAAAMAAPVTAILARETEIAVAGAKPLGDPSVRGAYLILAARALGLDCRPIWDFDAAMVERAFFPDRARVAAFLCGLGYGDATQPAPDLLRPGVDEACRIL